MNRDRTVDLTILFSTRNRGHILPSVLAGYTKLNSSNIAWELVIVDNGCEDDSLIHLQRASASLPLIIVTEAESGKNRALNTGLTRASGSLIILTDDDIIPDPNFLQEWAKYLSDRLEYDFFGGMIKILSEASLPSWMLQDRFVMQMMFAERTFPEGPIHWSDIYGCNMAIRRTILDAGFRLDPEIGPNDRDPFYPMGSESDFCFRLDRHGYRSWFAQGPIANHIIRPEQLNPANWPVRAYRRGRGRARLRWKMGTLKPSRRRHARNRMGRELNFLLKRISPWPIHNFEAMCQSHYVRGFKDECLRLGVVPYHPDD